MTRQEVTIIAILGGNPVVANALALLLEGEGYTTKVIGEYPTEDAAELLEGVDVLLLYNGLSNGTRQKFLSFLRSSPKTAQMVVLRLSSDLKEELVPAEDEYTAVAWPTRIGNLTQQIEAALRATEKHYGEQRDQSA